MSIILAIDTSTEACSCALNIDGRIVEHFEVIPRQHANRLLAMIDALMAEHRLAYTDLNAVAFGRGPGSFTGLRIATGVAQGIAFGANLPIVPVSTLAALALQAKQKTGESHVFSCIDARINEVYWGLFHFSEDEPRLHGSECLCAPALIEHSALESAEQWYGAGNGFLFLDKMSTEIQRSKLSGIALDMLPHAADIASLASLYYQQGLIQKPSAVAPVYLRDKVTHN